MAGVQNLINQYQNYIDGPVGLLKNEYCSLILPAYRMKYPTGDIPAALIVDDQEIIDGYGSPGMVVVTRGVAKHPLSCFRTFAIAHETGHAVTPKEFERLGVPMWNPGLEDLRLEKIADLIGMKLLMDHFPQTSSEIYRNLARIAKDLGNPGPSRMMVVNQLCSGRTFGQLIHAVINNYI
jgi:hypothetical protein